MLKSVYENGGFYIGRYEAGTETARFSATDKLTDAVIQIDKYPYIFVKCSEAQEKSKELATGGKQASLMFGIQWDLVLKFIEEKGIALGETKTERQNAIKTNSEKWGNYKNVAFEVKRGLYTATPETYASWDNASNYTKPTSAVLLTTGATERNKILNIYDLAGNVWEWTLEFGVETYGSNRSCIFRGGTYYGVSNSYPAYYAFGPRK